MPESVRTCSSRKVEAQWLCAGSLGKARTPAGDRFASGSIEWFSRCPPVSSGGDYPLRVGTGTRQYCRDERPRLRVPERSAEEHCTPPVSSTLPERTLRGTQRSREKVTRLLAALCLGQKTLKNGRISSVWELNWF